MQFLYCDMYRSIFSNLLHIWLLFFDINSVLLAGSISQLRARHGYTTAETPGRVTKAQDKNPAWRVKLRFKGSRETHIFLLVDFLLLYSLV